MTNEPPTPVYTVNGKEVLCDGKHFADFRDADAARAVCTLLNCQEVLHEPGTSDDELDHMVAVLWG